ncbi:MAG: amidohydrolase [Phycisphaerae bacterium]
MKTKKVALRSSRHIGAIRAAVRRIGAEGIDISDRIAAFAEPPLKEFKSADLLADFLSRKGFAVSRPWRNLPTAFRAVAGKGGPAVAILAEYDALPDCGPRTGQWGHGCGHNLLGAAAALAGVAAAGVLAKLKRPGRIVVIGTPAEETLGGKVFIGQQRGYRGLDAVLAWHPGSETRADLAGLTAMDSILFEFRGRTSHAAGGPHKGRSALDAAMLMDVMINYLREHVESNCRMHCVITDGGKAPNVVPDRASIWYYIRGKDRRQVDGLRRRVVLCAKSAATATETAWRMDVISCCTERVQVKSMAEMVDAVLRRCGAPKFSAADLRAARKVMPKAVFNKKIEPIKDKQGHGSSDEDNVSWFAPLGRMSVACVPKDTIGHHRDEAALSVTSGAHRGMVRAAEALAACAVELAINPAALRAATAEFRKAMKGRKYKLPLSPRAVELSEALAARTAPKSSP